MRRLRERRDGGARRAVANVPIRIWRQLIRRGDISETESHDPYALGQALCDLADKGDG